MKNLYLTAILPPDDLTTEIDGIRKSCATRFKVSAALKPPVHITLFRPIKLDKDLEGELVAVLENIKKSNQPFTVELKDFDIFRKHVVFINVLKSLELWKLADQVKDEYYEHKLAMKDPNDHKDFHPHITIAFRDIPPQIFPELWAFYKDSRYTASFSVNSFSLLKHDGSKWLPYKNFDLK